MHVLAQNGVHSIPACSFQSAWDSGKLLVASGRSKTASALSKRESVTSTRLVRIFLYLFFNLFSKLSQIFAYCYVFHIEITR